MTRFLNYPYHLIMVLIERNVSDFNHKVAENNIGQIEIGDCGIYISVITKENRISTKTSG